MMEGVDWPTWWQWWILSAITINTVVNLIVFFVGRKFKRSD